MNRVSDHSSSWLFSWRPDTLPDSWAPVHGWMLTRVLIAAAILVCLAYAALASPRIARRLGEKARQLAHRILLAVLAIAALLSVAVYLDFGVFRYGTFLNEWDFFHYYVGTKYAPELGYTKLYAATLLADRELGPRYHNPQNLVRDLASAELRPTETIIVEASRYRGVFTDARWREFVADIGWFREQLPAERWSLLLVDHGYNGTPAWSFLVGALFTRHLSVRAPAQKWVMLLLDPLLLATAITVVAWAFGARTAFLMVIFIGTHYLFSWGHLKGALLRTDFAMCSTLAVCLVKKGRYGLAGALLGWAISSRIFPVFFLAGPIALLAWGALRERRLDRSWLRMLSTCATTIALVVAASCVYFGGFAIWREWAQKIALHYVGGSDWDLGYRTVVESLFVHGVPVHAGSLGQEVARAAGSTAAWTVVAALVLVPAVSFLRALEDYQAVAYGFVFIYMLSLAAYYYYLVLAVPLLFFAPSIDKLQSALGVAFMFLTGYFGYLLFSGWQPLADFVAFRGWRQTFPTYYYLSCLIAITIAQMVVLAATRAKEKRQTLSEPPRSTQRKLSLGGPSVE